MAARELVARAIWCADSHPGAGIDGDDADRMSDAALSALTAAGFRLLAPGQIDEYTRERCAGECDRIDNECGMEAGLAASCAESLRALTDEVKP